MMVNSYGRNRSSWAALLDRFTVGVTIMVVEIDNNGLPVDLVYDYVNQAYADLYGIKKEDHMGKSIYEIDKDIDSKYIYNVWDTACNGVNKESEQYGIWCKKYIKCRLFQIEYGVCCAIIEDNTVNHRMMEMLQDKKNIGDNSLKFDYIFEYMPKTDMFAYLRHIYSDEENRTAAGRILNFKARINELDPLIKGFSAESALKAFCDGKGGSFELMLMPYKRIPNKLQKYRITSWSVESDDGSRRIVGTMLRV